MGSLKRAVVTKRRMKGDKMRWPLVLLVLSLISCGTTVEADGKICSLSYCQCEDTDVSCQGQSKEDLELSSSSLPSSITSLNLVDLASVTVKTNTFSGQEDLKELSFEKIDKVVLGSFCYSRTELSGHITHFKMENIKDLVLETGNSFDHVPQISHVVIRKVGMKVVPTGGIKLYSDTMNIENCDIGELHKESIYTDSQNFIFINNKVKVIKSYAISGSNNKFNFSSNDISKIEANAISVAFLSGDLSRNTFHAHTGAPLRDVGPEPVCMPDQTAYNYDDPVEYKIVATPTFVFEGNYFPQFSLSVLDLPGAQNVPLGALTINANKVPCDCEAIKELAVLSDFDHLEETEREEFELGALIFKKEFYSSGLCVSATGEEVRLKKFARSWLEITEADLKCTDPKERKERLRPKKLKEIVESKTDILADDPQVEKVDENSFDQQPEPKVTVTSKPVKYEPSSAVISTNSYIYLLLLTIFQKVLR